MHFHNSSELFDVILGLCKGWDSAILVHIAAAGIVCCKGKGDISVIFA